MATIPTDAYFSQQWYLDNTITGQFDLDVIDVWDDYTGKGMVVAVMDSGIDYAHADLTANYDTSRDHDFGAGDDDAAPVYSSESHGTAVTGIIGAAANGTGVVGVAYESTLMGYRIDLSISPESFTAQMVAGFAAAADEGIDVLNMSFGQNDAFDAYLGQSLMADVITAIDQAVVDGRGGLGAILVKAAGNSRGDGINVNASSQNSDTHQIIVAAVNRDGFVSNYSSFGTPILISAFGSPGSGNGQIVTDDRTGSLGYSSGDINLTFNGTSAAAPMVSGIVALMLEANSDLGWRDIQTILATSARHVGSDVGATSASGSERYLWGFNTASTWNGGGLHFSEDYGYGLVDARGAVRLAETWQAAPSTSANEKSLTLDLFDGTETLPDNNVNGKGYTAKAGDSLLVERVTIDLTFQITRTSDLAIYLTGPDGVEHLLSADAGAGETLSYDGTFTFQSQAYRGVSSKGEWSVRAVDDQTGNTITLSDIKINLYGAADSKNDTYYYTDEFSDYLDTHSTTLKDSDGGTDILNAAAVTAAISVNLAKGMGTIDGVAIKLSGVENVYGGDSDDILVGSKGNNNLAGDRGADTLTGGKGKDEFFYFTLKDSRSAESHDLITDFAKGDKIDLSNIDAIKDDLDANDKFSFVGSQDFTAVGQLRLEFVDLKGSKHDLTYVEANVAGDGTADFMIELAGIHKLKGSDFML